MSDPRAIIGDAAGTPRPAAQAEQVADDNAPPRFPLAMPGYLILDAWFAHSTALRFPLPRKLVTLHLSCHSSVAAGMPLVSVVDAPDNASARRALMAGSCDAAAADRIIRAASYRSAIWQGRIKQVLESPLAAVMRGRA